MLEKKVEDHLSDEVKALGGLAVKLDPTGYAGIPDRLVLLPGGRLVFAELKRPKRGRVAKLQVYWHGLLRDLGFRVELVRTLEAVDTLLAELSPAHCDESV